ncbi:MAG: hypothetical protein ABJD07_11590, partial [Gemmatimonadaceae bacterium]
MPLPRELLEEMAARNRGAEIEANRDKRLDYVRTGAVCMAWSVFGVGCILWSAHTTDPLYGRVAFIAGQGLGYSMIIFTLLGLYR